MAIDDDLRDLERLRVAEPDAAGQADELAAAAAKEREARDRRAAKVDELTVGFDRQVAGLLEGVASAATQLQGTANSLSSTAEQANGQSTACAAASEQATGNVQTVATAPAGAASVRHSQDGQLPARQTAHHRNPLLAILIPAPARGLRMPARISQVSDPFPRPLARLSLVSLVGFYDPSEAVG